MLVPAKIDVFISEWLRVWRDIAIQQVCFITENVTLKV